MTALPRRTRTLAVTSLLVLGLTGLGGCGDGGGADAAPVATTAAPGAAGTAGDGSSTTLAPGSLPGADGEATDTSPFCTSIRGIRDLGADGTAGATPAEVLTQNEQLRDLLDEATASVPEGAPADVESLFDDYRRIAEAIGTAAGDVDAAYAAIEADDPALAARLYNETAHLPAFEFFATRCGVSLG